MKCTNPSINDIYAQLTLDYLEFCKVSGIREARWISQCPRGYGNVSCPVR